MIPRCKPFQIEIVLGLMAVVLPLAISCICLYAFPLQRQINDFRELDVTVCSFRWLLTMGFCAWLVSLLFLTFRLEDLPLIGLMLIGVFSCIIKDGITCYPGFDLVTLLFSVTLAKGARFLLQDAKTSARSRRFMGCNLPIVLAGLVGLLAFSSWWHLDLTGNYYHGPRWTGFCDNPDTYGMLMGAGVVLAIGLLRARAGLSEGVKRKVEEEHELAGKILFLFLKCIFLVAAGMMGVGLLFSYSRGAWLGTVAGLFCLARAYGTWRFRRVLPGIIFGLMVVLVFWNATPDSAPWYVKRMDFGRPSAQHRVAAWKAGFEIMRDHPLGVGWGMASRVYEDSYSAPEGGAAALMTNDYLLLGTQLGVTALFCFILYIVLAFKSKGPGPFQITCRAGAGAMLVTFWFDGGLFELPSAVLFWMLLEFGKIETPAIIL